METITSNELQMNIFHICIKGHDSITIYTDEEDYSTSVNYIAIAQYRSNISILAYCQMPNHSHFVMETDSDDDIMHFIIRYKRLYSMYFNRKYREYKIFRRQDILIKKINSLHYLRQCIAYVLRNPLAAGLIRTIDFYPWTSHACYFRNNDSSMNESYPVASLSKREIRKVLKTHIDLTGCRYCIDHRNGMIVPRTFVDYKTVESIYNNSASMFTKFVGWNDDNKMEYELLIKQTYSYDDIEMKSIADIISLEKYRKSCLELLPEQKRELAFILRKKYRTSVAQLSRVLRIRKEALL